MKIDVLQVGFLQTNCYIVTDEETNKGVIIDPGASPERILNKVKEIGCEIEYILLTHGHFDHIGALGDVLLHINNAKVVFPEKDKDLFYDDDMNLWNKYARGTRTKARVDRFVSENDIIKCGNLEFKYIETPGHTIGSSCILCGDVMFSGDMLFKMTVGRVDHPTGDFKTLMQSVEKLKQIDKDYVVYPGHAETTTLDHEKKYNPYFTREYDV